MGEKIDLKELEKKAYRSCYQDGLYDILIGFMFLGLGFGSFFREMLPEPWKYFLWPLAVIGVGIILFYLGKRKITTPRMGYVKFGSKKGSVKRKLLIFTVINTTISVIFLILILSGVFREIFIEGYIAGLTVGLLFITIPLSILGYILLFPRMYVIAVIGGISFFVAELLYPSLGIPLGGILSLGTIGGIIVVEGLYFFIRFLQNYPLPKEEMA